MRLSTGGIPGPIAFGWVIDKACLLWQDQCGQQGSCFVYQNSAMSRYMLIAGLVYKVSGAAAAPRCAEGEAQSVLWPAEGPAHLWTCQPPVCKAAPSSGGELSRWGPDDETRLGSSRRRPQGLCKPAAAPARSPLLPCGSDQLQPWQICPLPGRGQLRIRALFATLMCLECRPFLEPNSVSKHLLCYRGSSTAFIA